ncbi:unnamed protein product [Strongylus vulgaris]|uniref:Uncharacterized protein n=1 Tax=Strongylus vulgaris TaxID=40348 RepID=A0A3P7IC91_STRVU|nr:unnamed protein product [Strongylus vulgaris]
MQRLGLRRYNCKKQRSITLGKEVSKRGTHPVLVYAGTSYSFALARRGARHDSCICIGCEKSGAWKSMKVRGEFPSDPRDMQHVCEAKNKAEEIAT